jgi:hypothetical protein
MLNDSFDTKDSSSQLRCNKLDDSPAGDGYPVLSAVELARNLPGSQRISHRDIHPISIGDG